MSAITEAEVEDQNKIEGGGRILIKKSIIAFGVESGHLFGSCALFAVRFNPVVREINAFQ